MDPQGGERRDASAQELERLRARCRELEELHAALGEHAHDLVAILDEQGRVTQVSPNLARVLGHDPDGQRGASLSGLQIHPEDQARVVQAFVRGRETGQPQRVTFRRHDTQGRWHWFECWGRGFVNARGQRRAIVISREISERRRVERLQEEQTRLLERLATGLGSDEALDALVRMAEQGAPGIHCALMLRDEPNGRLRVAAAPSLPEAAIRSIERVVPDAPLPEKSDSPGPLAPCCGDGLRDLGLHACWCQPIALPGVGVVGTLAMYRRAREEPSGFERLLLDTVSHLASLVVARDRSRREHERLQGKLLQTQRLESLGLLAGGIAHDFNNLLTGILGNATLLLASTRPADPDHGCLADVVQAAEHAAELTRQLLAYAGRAQFHVEPLDLAECLRGLAPLVRRSLPSRATLRLELPEDLPRVEADPTQLQQLVMNLALNGAEALGDGGGDVEVSVAPVRLAHRHVRDGLVADDWDPGLHVAIRVRDEGCGMDEAIRERIFDPFFSTKFTGRGLGLANVLGIVRAHRGALRLESRPGDGTLFEIFLPASQRAPLQPSAPDSLAATGSGGRILLVDDEPAVRRTGRRILESAGYAVVTAEDGKQALEHFRIEDGRFDLVLLDLTMPVLDGRETLRELRSLRADVPVLVASGYDEEDAIRRLGAQTGVDFVPKPFSARSLLAGVRTVLGGSAHSSA